MVKVNYYKVNGFEKHEPETQGVIYGRSKKDVLNVASKRGFKEGTLEGVREMSLKEEVSKMFNETQLFEMRKKDKENWEEIPKRNPKTKEEAKDSKDKKETKKAPEEKK